MTLLSRLLGRSGEASGETPRPVVTIVSGLPRSGTSMMMRLVEAAGLEVLCDEIREANSDNPHGYYEFERVKRLRDGDAGWVPGADGRVVKVISALLEYLPDSCDYRVLFVQRDLEEVLASQAKMLENREEDRSAVDEEELRSLYGDHLEHIKGWLARQPNFRVLYVDHRRMVTAPEAEVRTVAEFLDAAHRIQDMTAAVDPSLYRQRAGTVTTPDSA